MNKLTVLFLVLALSLFTINCQTFVPTSRSAQIEHKLRQAKQGTNDAIKVFEEAKFGDNIEEIKEAGDGVKKEAEKCIESLEQCSEKLRSSEADIQSMDLYRSLTWGLGTCCAILLTLIVFIVRRK